MKAPATCDRIIEAADRLIYEKGFEYMSFADLANAVGISRGNVTFHFQTRHEILDAVIDRRLARTTQMLAQWEAAGQTSEARILSFISILIMNRAKIMLFGCPVGTLCTELAKLEHSARPRANQVFGLFRDWLARQFSQLGCGTQSEALAMHLLAWSQGIATLANAFHDEEFIRAEVRQLEAWLRSIAAQRQPPSRRAPAARTGKTARPAARRR